MFSGNHSEHIVSTRLGPWTGDTTATMGDGSVRIYTMQSVVSNCSCVMTLPPDATNVVATGYITISISPDPVEFKQSRLENPDRKFSNGLKPQKPRMVDSFRSIRRPEFHARSNPRRK